MFSFDLPSDILSMISRCEHNDLIDKLVGLSLAPQYQSNHLRILTLIQVALARAKGRHRANHADLSYMLNGLLSHEAGKNEDPAEDVFASSVSTASGEFLIFNGIYIAADFSLQRVLDALLQIEYPARDRLAKECQSLLTLSDAIARRCGLSANDYEVSQPWQDKWPASLRAFAKNGRYVRFAWGELTALGLSDEQLSPFFLQPGDEILNAPFGRTILGRRPLIRDGTGVSLPIPSLVSSAIRLHLAHAVASGFAPMKAAEDFFQLQFARWLLCDMPARGARAIEVEQFDLPFPDFEPPGDYNSAVVRFDTDKVAHLIVLEADWSEPPDQAINTVTQASADFDDDLAKHLGQSFEVIATHQNSERGLTLVIYDTPGWHFNFSVGHDLATEWYVAGVGAYSLSMLLADPHFSLLDLWKLFREQRRMREVGILVRPWPDLLNLWSIWRAMDQTFWPRGIDLRQFGSFLPDTSKIQEQVAATRIIRNVHAVPSVVGNLRRVERWVDADAPDSEYSKPIYLEPMALPLGELRSVVDTSHGAWWVASARPPFDREDRRYLYLVWQSAGEWLVRLASHFPEPFRERRGLAEIRLLPVPATIRGASDQIELIWALDAPIVTITLPNKFFDDLNTPDNRGEAVLVRALAQAIAGALKLDLTQHEIEQWAADVTRDPALKMMHITPSADIGLFIDLIVEGAPYRLLQPPDLASASLHIYDDLRKIPQSGIGPSSQLISGAEPVTRALKAVVDIRWQRCRHLLRTLDRTALLLLVSRLIEAIHRRRVDAERAALSRSRLYSESQNIDMWAKLTMGERDAAFRAFRIIVEMAICEAPVSGGRSPGVSDVDTLAAEITLLIQTADWNDAVRFGLVTPKLEFLPDGSMKAESGGAEVFMQEYLAACLGESISLDIDAYPTLYEVQGPGKIAMETSDNTDAFLIAFKDEYGISLEASARVSSALQKLALDKTADVVQLRQSELESQLESGEYALQSNIIRDFLSAFGLVSRPAWDEAPIKPFRQDDVWPWLFERRLSLMTRPVIIVAPELDPTIVYGVRQIDMGLRYASTLLETGIWSKEKLSSDAAKNYVDAEANRRGTAFELKIAEKVRQAGWRSFSDIAMRRLGAVKKLGNVDVLAVSPDTATWIVIECKWFGAARIPREVANWIQDYRGRSGDKLDRHLQRYAWIVANSEAIAKRLGIDSPTNVFGRIVTTSPVPLAFTANLVEPATVWTQRQLMETLSNYPSSNH